MLKLQKEIRQQKAERELTKMQLSEILVMNLQKKDSLKMRMIPKTYTANQIAG
jgi:hypothetical protein